MGFENLEKTRARNAAKIIRSLLDKNQPDAGIELIKHWPRLGIKSGRIAGYIPIGSEIDIIPLMQALADSGHDLCLPVVRRKHKPLIFRKYSMGDILVRGAFGTKVPKREMEIVRPDIVLVPLLAYSPNGYRLGYGGGYYDRTLASLRSTGKVFACGIAFSGQEVPILPTDAYDERLDGILTENGYKNFRK